MENKKNIEWRIIEEFPMYEVSNYADVRNTKTGKILKPRVNRGGYLSVMLFQEGMGTKGSRSRYIHRLAAIAFLPNPDNLPQVNHKDQNKDNCYVGCAEKNYEDGNLEWCTSKYNIAYSDVVEKMTAAKRGKKRDPNSLFQSIPVWLYNSNNELIAVCESITNASHYLNCSYGTIKRHLKNKKPYKGLYFYGGPKDFEKNEN